LGTILGSKTLVGLKMGVHSIHIFDRKGKTLFTKRYVNHNNAAVVDDEEQQSEQRKLVFGMVYSLKGIAKILSPTSPTTTTSSSLAMGDNHNNNNSNNLGLHTVQTGASTLHVYETASGLRICLYMDPAIPQHQAVDHARKIRAALHHMYQQLWIQCVTRSPLYKPTNPNVHETNFEATLDEFLEAQPWFA
jgi:trafficking protein particle complex subunit 1